MPNQLDGLEENELISQLPKNTRRAIDSMQEAGTNWNAIGERLAQAPSNAVAAEKGQANWSEEFWQEVKEEFAVFLCTDHEKYSDLRSKGEELGEKNTDLLVSAISGIIGSQIGVAAGIVAPLVVWLLVTGSRIGTEALCTQLLSDSQSAV